MKIISLLVALALTGGAADSKKGADSKTVVLPSPEDRPRYTGEKISLNLKDADLRDVVSSFADLSGLSFVVDPEVKGTATVTLKDVPWDQALELILMVNGCGSVREGKVMRVAPVAKLMREESTRCCPKNGSR